jgi:hypothetical protein
MSFTPTEIAAEIQNTFLNLVLRTDFRQKIADSCQSIDDAAQERTGT